MQILVKSLFSVTVTNRPPHQAADGACAQGASPPLERGRFEKLISLQCTAQRDFFH